MNKPIAATEGDCIGIRLERTGVLIEHLMQLTLEDDTKSNAKAIEAAVLFLSQEHNDWQEERQHFIDQYIARRAKEAGHA